MYNRVTVPFSKLIALFLMQSRETEREGKEEVEDRKDLYITWRE
jgi:hypothetical protein